ncbi:reverse transcriptase domain-containing protein [Tanacetum coccineum]
MLRVFPISLTGAASRWLRNEPTGSIKTWEDLKTKFLNKYCPLGRTAKKMEEINNFQQEPDETLYQAWERFKEILMKCPQHYLTEMQEVILFYNGLDVLTRQILDSRGAIPAKTTADAKRPSKKWQNTLKNGTMEHLEEEERGFGSLPSSTETNMRDQVKSILTTIEADSHLIHRASVSVMPLLTYLNLGLGELAHTKLTVELADRTVKYPKGITENVLTILSTARAKIDVYEIKITLRVKEEKIIFKCVTTASSLIKKVYMLSLRERMELDLEARLMGETLLKRNQGDDLMPTIKEGEVIEKFRTRDEDLDTRIDDYPSYCDDDKKIHIDCAHNLKFSCMIGFEFTHVNFFPLLYVNVMSKKFHNSIMKDKMVYKGDNVIGALMNVLIFVGTFSVVTDFAVLEDMDAYCDKGMGDVIVGEPFLREVRIKAKMI